MYRKQYTIDTLRVPPGSGSKNKVHRHNDARCGILIVLTNVSGEICINHPLVLLCARDSCYGSEIRTL